MNPLQQLTFEELRHAITSCSQKRRDELLKLTVMSVFSDLTGEEEFAIEDFSSEIVAFLVGPKKRFQLLDEPKLRWSTDD